MKNAIDYAEHIIIDFIFYNKINILQKRSHPAYVGGITEVAKGLWMKRDTLKVERLMIYAQRLGVGAVIRRLGYLLEHYELADAQRSNHCAAY